MRILFDARPLQSASGRRGIGRYVFELLAALAIHAPDVEFTFLRTRRGDPPRLPPGVPKRWIEEPITLPEQSRGYLDAMFLGRLLRASTADLYHSPEYGLPGSARIPVVATVHDLVPWVLRHPSYLRQRLRWAAQRRLLRKATAIICDSDSTARDLRDGAPRANLRVIHPGIGEAFFAPADLSAVARIDREFGDDFALMVGECDWRKRPEDAIAAVARSSQALRLVIVGPNDRHRREIMEMARASGIPGRVVIAGVLSDPDLRAVYGRARVLLFPSRYEGFGFPVLEAAASGLPVVAYRNSSLPELLGSGLELVPDGDLDSFTARTRDLIENPRTEWDAAAAQKLAARFTWQRTAEQVRVLYGEVLDGRR